jgi:hypothetical protein
LKGQTLSKGLDVGHIQIQTTFYKIRVKKMLSFLASSTFFKYGWYQNFYDVWTVIFFPDIKRPYHTGTEINFYRQ